MFRILWCVSRKHSWNTREIQNRKCVSPPFRAIVSNIAANLASPTEYRKVHVLAIKWHLTQYLGLKCMPAGIFYWFWDIFVPAAIKGLQWVERDVLYFKFDHSYFFLSVSHCGGLFKLSNHNFFKRAPNLILHTPHSNFWSSSSHVCLFLLRKTFFSIIPFPRLLSFLSIRSEKTFLLIL